MGVRFGRTYSDNGADALDWYLSQSDADICRLCGVMDSREGVSGADDGCGFREHDEMDCGITKGFKSAGVDVENLVVGNWHSDEADDQKLGDSIGGGTSPCPGDNLAVLAPLPMLLTDDRDAAGSCGSNDMTISTWSEAAVPSCAGDAAAPPHSGSEVRRS